MSVKKAFKEWLYTFCFGDDREEILSNARIACAAREQDVKNQLTQEMLLLDPKSAHYMQEVRKKICVESGRRKPPTPADERSLDAELKAFGVSIGGEEQAEEKLADPVVGITG